MLGPRLVAETFVAAHSAAEAAFEAASKGLDVAEAAVRPGGRQAAARLAHAQAAFRAAAIAWSWELSGRRP